MNSRRDSLRVGSTTDVPLYDQFSANYDRFVNWKNRLSAEMPFLVDQVEAAGGRRVLDTACGTGQHTIALAQRGFEVTGSDLSAPMLVVARQNAAAAGAGASFVQAGFGQLAQSVDGIFDAVLCLGNSLPHALTRESLADTLRDFRALLRPGGALVVQNRNFDLVWSTRDRFMPPETYQEGEQEWIFVRFYDFHEDTLTFNVNTLHRHDGTWSSSVESTELRPIFQQELASLLADAGFTHVKCYGGLSDEPFIPLKSGNLVVVARSEE